jgi:hypothetical protein
LRRSKNISRATKGNTVQDGDVIREIWPIGLRLSGGRRLYTAWAGTSGDDLLLSERRGILLFQTLPRLASYFEGRHRNNMSSLRGYRSAKPTMSIRREGRSIEWFLVDDTFVALSEQKPADYDRKTCIVIVNVLNLFWDAARTLHDERAEEKLVRGAPLAKLLDILTFYDPALVSPPRSLQRLQSEPLVEDFLFLVGWLTLRSIIAE